MRKRTDKRWEDMDDLHGFSHKRFRAVRKKIRRRIKRAENRDSGKINGFDADR